MNQAFSSARVASSITRMPRALQNSQVALMFSMDMGWPPAMFTLVSLEMYGMRSAPYCSTTAASLARSKLPLKGWVLAGWWASSMMTSTKRPPAYSWWNRVVVKYMFPGITSPGSMRIWLRMCSAPRPWWVGTVSG